MAKQTVVAAGLVEQGGRPRRRAASAHRDLGQGHAERDGEEPRRVGARRALRRRAELAPARGVVHRRADAAAPQPVQERLRPGGWA